MADTLKQLEKEKDIIADDWAENKRVQFPELISLTEDCALSAMNSYCFK